MPKTVLPESFPWDPTGFFFGDSFSLKTDMNHLPKTSLGGKSSGHVFFFWFKGCK